MPEGLNRTDKRQRLCVFTHLGLMEYTEALALQQAVLKAKLLDPSEKDQLFFVEHLPVYTLGRRGGRENLVVGEDFLKSQGIDIVQTDRGGNITYHGPGQAVLYPIIDLEKNRLSVPDFVFGMEEIMKLTAEEFEVPADRDERNHGLWVGNKKIGSVGISIKKGISIHGLAMNVNPDLTPFSWINPCGLANQAMTSIAAEQNLPSLTLSGTRQETVSPDTLMARVCERFIYHFSTQFNIQVTSER